MYRFCDETLLSFECVRSSGPRERLKSLNPRKRTDWCGHPIPARMGLPFSRLITGKQSTRLLEFKRLNVASKTGFVELRRRRLGCVSDRVLALPDLGLGRELRLRREGTSQFAVVDGWLSLSALLVFYTFSF